MDKVTLEKEVPRPSDWNRKQDTPYYFENRKTGKTIAESTYYAKVKKRNILAEYISEIVQYEEEIPVEHR